MKTSTWLAFIMAFLVVVFAWLYFVTQFSATYPPIKEYQYSVNVQKLEASCINIINKQSNLSYQITDTVGNVENGFAYYMDILNKDSIMDFEYNVKFESDNSTSKRFPSARISLIGVFDKKHKTGGYTDKGEDVEKLKLVFEKDIIAKLDAEYTSR